MAQKKPTRKGSGGKRKRQPSRKIPLILQTRILETEGGQEEVTIGDLIVRACCLGAFRAEAAQAAGVSRTTVFNWQRRGEDAIAAAEEHIEDGEQVKVKDVPKSERPFVDFVYALEEGESSAELWHIRNILKHAEKDWHASSWFLARRWHERWGSREHPDSGAGGMTLADLERLVDDAA